MLTRTMSFHAATRLLTQNDEHKKVDIDFSYTLKNMN